MSHENLIDRALNELGLAASTLAVLSGINRTRISECLRGKSSFTGPETIKLTALIAELRSIVSETQPIPIDFADCAAVQKLLLYRHEGIKYTAVAKSEELDASE